ncbi:phosphoglycerate dehydrogenase [Verticiella sediminum]|uniref:D-3-phosphoglycerate dehydrogenase n=1 Tax=Verticiella sediminum TaxID=1247510 RepID=A0A556AIZ7_9BURK|nr:phosphoglycerate dehydrogenase [Verticiella sediminum]TSH92846.1 phosphoglycerate dehydrogenase [Verticiella sediminum]
MSTTSLDKRKIKFALLEGIHPSAVERIQSADYHDIQTFPKALEGEELLKVISEVHFIGIRSQTRLTAEVLEHARKLTAIGCFCIGTNQVDLNAARDKGIPVFNAPYSNTRSVAELVLAEAILLLRGVPEKSTLAHRGVWRKSAANAFELRGKTLGIVGYGSIGTQLSVLAEAMGMRVVFYDVVTKLPLGNARQVRSLKELMTESDVVSLHVPQTAATQWMIGEEQIAAMKPTSVLINASRGKVVVIEALNQALRAGKLLGAAVDVFPTEPGNNSEPFESPLRGLDNVILTPHVGGSTVEAQSNIGLEVAEKLVKYSDNGTTISSVNFPEVALPSHPGKHRLLHVHRNVPGILSEINKVLADAQANISAQYLQTNESIGYVVTDVDTAYSEAALAKIAEIPGTLRSRILF